MKPPKPVWRWNRRNSLIVTLPLVAATIVYLVQVYLPMERKIAELRQKREQTEMMLQQAQQFRGAIGPARVELAQTKRFVNDHLRTLPTEQAASDALGEIAILADQAGTKMERFEPGDTSELKYLARVPVSLTCRGEFPALFDFLGRLEALPRKIWIDEMRLEAPREAGQPTRCELKLVIFATRAANSN